MHCNCERIRNRSESDGPRWSCLKGVVIAKAGRTRVRSIAGVDLEALLEELSDVGHQNLATRLPQRCGDGRLCESGEGMSGEGESGSRVLAEDKRRTA